MFCLAYFSFNSMIVRLKVQRVQAIPRTTIRFNSMIVRLKGVCSFRRVERYSEFQFYDSPIKRISLNPNQNR